MEYKNKNQEYFKLSRHDIISIIPKVKNQSILEIGASGGYTLAELKRLEYCSYCAGVELFQIENSLQQSKLIDEFHFADVERDEIIFENKKYDIVIFADILEHLVNPEEALEKFLKYLKPGGAVILSIPNIRYIKILYKIFIQGNFEYTENGVLDRTHLRFYCKKNALNLLLNKNLKIERTYYSYNLQKQKKLQLLNILTLGLLKDFLTIQYIIIAKK